MPAALAATSFALGLMAALVIYQTGFEEGRHHELALQHMPPMVALPEDWE